ncbi:MAG: DUF86 domain-containing protein [Clostridia bacterium]|nr:MAG: DUF86 domain-containing protein [Clostridia bacterium]
MVKAGCGAPASPCTSTSRGLPKSYREAVIIAARNGLIPEDMLPAYEAMARFRNRLDHLYDRVDDHELWKIIQENLDDFKPFIAGVVQRYCRG